MKYICALMFFSLIITSVSAQKKVGIGIETPSSRLHIHQENPFSDPSSKIQLTNSSTGLGINDGLLLSQIVGDGSLMNRESGSLHLGTNNINRLSIFNSGRLGLNTTNILGSSDFTIRSFNAGGFGGMYIDSPSDVNGKPFYGYAANGNPKMWHYFDAATQSWKVNLNGDRLILLDSGKFGIGSSLPNQVLSVNGKIEIGNDSELATEGTIKWDGNDFEGYTGSEYKSFTYYEDRQSILGYEEFYNIPFCTNPETKIIYNTGGSLDTATCAVIYDTGGSNGGYGNNEAIGYTLGSPKTYTGGEHDYLKVIVESVDLEPNKDSLFIFIGNNVYTYTNTISTPDTFINKGIAVYVVFKSDGSNPQPYAGFKITAQFMDLDPLEENQLLGYYFNPGNKSLAAGLNFENEWQDSLGDKSISFGNYAKATGTNSIAIGEGSYAENANSIAIGRFSKAEIYDAISIGNQSKALYPASISIGASAKSDGLNSLALGYNSFANCKECIALGSFSSNSSDNSVVIGSSLISNIGGYQNWSNLSDGRFKKDIKEDIPGLEFIRALRPVTYKLDIQKLKLFQGQESLISGNENQASNEIRSGFIAQEVEAKAQGLGYDFSGVKAPKDTDEHYSLRYAEFVVPLVKAVQELDSENTKLQKEVDLLHIELSELKAIVQELTDK